MSLAPLTHGEIDVYHPAYHFVSVSHVALPTHVDSATRWHATPTCDARHAMPPHCWPPGASPLQACAVVAQLDTIPSLALYRCMQVEDIGQGHFGIAKKMIFRPTGEQVAVKFIERGEQVCSLNRPWHWQSAIFTALVFLQRPQRAHMSSMNPPWPDRLRLQRAALLHGPR